MINICKIGDIIVIEKYIGDDGERVSKHSFIVIDDTPGQIGGLNYSLVTNVMSSFRDEEHKNKKLRFKENLEITSDDIIADSKNNKSGYIKADQLIYFDKDKINYYVFAHVDSELLDELIRLIIDLKVENKLKANTRNLEKEPVTE